MTEKPVDSSETLTVDNRGDVTTLQQPHHVQGSDLEQQPPAVTTAEDPPDGGYGWVCVACCAAINASTWGINSTYSIFLAYYLSHNVFPGTSALAYAFIGGLSISMAMFVAPFATYINGKIGTRLTLHIGIFFETLSLLGASWATKKYQIILAQGVCFGWGMGFLFVASVGVPAQWFKKKRSLAVSITAGGSGAGGLIWTLATQKMIDTIGLSWAFRVLAIVSGSINLIASNLLRDRNKNVGARHKAFDWTLLRRPEFLFVQLWTWFSMLGYVILLFSLPSYAHAIGLTASQGSIVGAVFNLGQMLGRPVIGLTSDRWGRINLAALYSVLCGIFCMIFWIPSEAAPQPMGLLCFFAIVGGGLAGTFWTTVAPVEAEVVDLRDLPGALSWTWLLMVPFVTCAEAIGLELRRTNATHWIYINAQVFCGCVYIASGLCLLVLRGWKIGQLEEIEKQALRVKRIEEESDRVAPDTKGVTQDGFQRPALSRIESQQVANDAWKVRPLLRRMFKVKKI